MSDIGSQHSDERSNDVAILSVGAATAVGETASTTAAAVRAGVSGFAEHDYLDDLNGDRFVIAPATYLDSDASLVDRLVGLLDRAVGEALAGLPHDGDRPLQVWLALPEFRPGYDQVEQDALVERVTESLRHHVTGKRGRDNRPLTVHPLGHAGGALAVQQACEMHHSDNSRWTCIAGVDSYCDPDTLGWIEDIGQLHNGSNAYGMIPGEGAGAIVLGPAIDASGLWSTIGAVGVAREPHPFGTREVCIGEGLSDAVRQVVRDGSQFDQVYCDQNGDTYRCDEYGFTLARFQSSFVDGTDFQAPADCWG